MGGLKGENWSRESKMKKHTMILFATFIAIFGALYLTQYNTLLQSTLGFRTSNNDHIVLKVSGTNEEIVIQANPRPPRPPFDFRPRFNETDPSTLRLFEQRIESFVIGRIVISSINIVLYAYIAFFYIGLYRANKSKFTLSLVGLTIVLLVYSISSNPLILPFIWRTGPIWLGAFNFIPDIFATAAAIILIYLSKT
jgi:hypothetical protein